jgi:four helix bundle protein
MSLPGLACFGGNIMRASFRDLRVWQQAMELSLRVYKDTAQFPKYELYALAQQMRRAAVSIASNIAEGKGHRTDADFRRFLFHARGSLVELEMQILLAAKLEYLSEDRSQGLQQAATLVARSLAGLLNSLATTVNETTT